MPFESLAQRRFLGMKTVEAELAYSLAKNDEFTARIADLERELQEAVELLNDEPIGIELANEWDRRRAEFLARNKLPRIAP